MKRNLIKEQGTGCILIDRYVYAFIEPSSSPDPNARNLRVLFNTHVKLKQFCNPYLYLNLSSIVNELPLGWTSDEYLVTSLTDLTFDNHIDDKDDGFVDIDPDLNYFDYMLDTVGLMPMSGCFIVEQFYSLLVDDPISQLILNFNTRSLKLNFVAFEAFLCSLT